MLNENKNIDHLFREKLGDFEKDPPMFLWTNIQAKLNVRRKERRIAALKTVGIAAAIVLAFLAGWWVTNPSYKGAIPQNSVAIQKEINLPSETSTGKTIETAKIVPVNAVKTVSVTPGNSPKMNQASPSNLSTLATFAPSTSFINKMNGTAEPKSDELVLFGTEKEFLDKLHKNFKLVKKLTDWITAVKNDSTTNFGSNSKSLDIKSFQSLSTERPTATALNNPVKTNSGRWSLTAEFAPVFNGLSQNNRQGSNLAYNGAKNYSTQKTTAKNTISGGMMAGYKVGKRLVIKSGIGYNKISQSSRNVNLMAASPLYNVPGNAMIASTPSGQVNLNKTGNSLISETPNFAYLFAGSSENYSTSSELQQDIGFIEIPIQATYKLIAKKVNVGLTGGISTNILVGNKAVLSVNGAGISSGETANMRGVVYSGAVGLEVGYEITNRIVLTVEPRLKQYINSLSTNKSVDFKPSQLEVVTGLSYSFN
jgi:hypothetical protein